MNDIIFIDQSSIQEVGQKGTAKRNVLFLIKNGKKWAPLVVTAWKDATKLFDGATPPCVVRESRIEFSTRFYKGKAYTEATVWEAKNFVTPKEWAGETLQAINDAKAEWDTCDFAPSSYAKPAATAAATTPVDLDDLPF